jgi:pimeloyl-ACP methyl ester carboxylesterase
MTILALAADDPELFGDRVAGVVLIATSAGPVGIPTLGVLPGAAAYLAAGQAASMLEPAIRLLRRLPTSVAMTHELIRRFGFASHVPNPVVELVAETMLDTAMAVVADVLPRFGSYNQLAALGALRRVPTAVLVGDRDAITPVSCARQIADALPSAQLLIVPQAGHLVMLERPVLVNEALRAMTGGVRSRPTQPARSA